MFDSVHVYCNILFIYVLTGGLGYLNLTLFIVATIWRHFIQALRNLDSRNFCTLHIILFFSNFFYNQCGTPILCCFCLEKCLHRIGNTPVKYHCFVIWSRLYVYVHLPLSAPTCITLGRWFYAICYTSNAISKLLLAMEIRPTNSNGCYNTYNTFL